MEIENRAFHHSVLLLLKPDELFRLKIDGKNKKSVGYFFAYILLLSFHSESYKLISFEWNVTKIACLFLMK